VTQSPRRRRVGGTGRPTRAQARDPAARLQAEKQRLEHVLAKARSVVDMRTKLHAYAGDRCQVRGPPSLVSRSRNGMPCKPAGRLLLQAALDAADATALLTGARQARARELLDLKDRAISNCERLAVVVRR